MQHGRVARLLIVLGLCVLLFAGCLAPPKQTKQAPQPPSWLLIRPDFTPDFSRAVPTPAATLPPRSADGLPDPTWETVGVAPWVTPVAPEGAVTIQTSPDGQTLVYTAYHPGTLYASFYQAPTRGGTARRLNSQVAYDTSFHPQFSADSQTVVFKVSSFAGQSGLYSHARTGTTTITLTPSQVWEFVLTPDGQTVIYTPDTRSVEGGGLWRVPATGGAPQRLGGEIGLEGPFQVSPDGRLLAGYARRGETLEEGYDLYILPISGGAAVTLATGYALRAHGQSFTFAFTPDSSQVIWLDPSSATTGLHAMPVEGGTPRRLDAGGVPVLDFEVTQDSRYVVYRAGTFRDPLGGVYTVPLADGAPLHPLQLNAPLADGEYLPFFATSPDSRWVIFGVTLEDRSRPEVTYRAPIQGGTIITQTTVSNLFSPDGRWLVYTQTEPQPALYSQFLDGGPPILLNHALPVGYEIGWRQISPDSRYVLYSISPGMRASMPIVEGVYLAPIAGGPVVELSGAAGSGRQTYGWMLPDGRTALMQVDYDGDGLQAIYALDLGDHIPRSTGSPPN